MRKTSIFKNSLYFSENAREIVQDLIAYSFIILFIYTAASKIITIDSFASTLAKSPLIGKLNVVVAWMIPSVEITLSFLLVITSKRQFGLQLSLALMIIFTSYLLYMVFSGSKLPCHCGGVISTMTWNQHIWFNTGFIAMAIMGITLQRK